MIQKKVFEKAVMNERYKEIKSTIHDLESGADIYIAGNGNANGDYMLNETTRILIMQLLSDFMKQEDKT
jgi:hypothetical protein